MTHYPLQNKEKLNPVLLEAKVNQILLFIAKQNKQTKNWSVRTPCNHPRQHVSENDHLQHMMMSQHENHLSH